MTHRRGTAIHAIEAVFVAGVAAAYIALAGGLIGLLDARLVSLIALIGSGVGAVAVLAFALFSENGLRYPRSPFKLGRQ